MSTNSKNIISSGCLDMQIIYAIVKDLPFSPCTYCKDNAILCCKLCGLFYCSKACQELDREKHHTTCIPPLTLAIGGNKQAVKIPTEQQSKHLNKSSREDQSTSFQSDQMRASTSLQSDQMSASTSFQSDQMRAKANEEATSFSKFLTYDEECLFDYRRGPQIRDEKEYELKYVSLHREMKDLVKLCHVTSPENFHVQKIKQLMKIKFITNQLKVFGSKENDCLYKPKINEICAALFPFDNLWQRALVLKVERLKCTVLYADYGNVKKVQRSELKKIPPFLMNIPVLSIKCCLDGVYPIEDQWTESAMQRMELLMSEKFVVNVIERKDICFKVELVTKNGLNLAEVLAKERLAIWYKYDFPVDVLFNKLRTDSNVFLKVTLDKSSSDAISFYALAFTSEKAMNELKLMDKWLQNSKPDTLLSIKAKMLIAAYSTKYSHWYRAYVLDALPNNEYEVFYIDVGEKEVVVRVSLLKDIVYFIPTLLLHCIPVKTSKEQQRAIDSVVEMKISAMSKGVIYMNSPMNHSDSLKCCPWFSKLTENSSGKSSLKANVSSQEKVQEIFEKTIVLDEIIEEQTSKEEIIEEETDEEKVIYDNKGRQKLEIGQEISFVVRKVLPDAFFINLLDNLDAMNKLSIVMKEYAENTSPPASFEINTIYVAYYQNDQIWYRVSLMKEYKDTAKVFLLDNGIIDAIEKTLLRPMDSKFMEFPLQGILTKVADIEMNPKKLVEAMEELEALFSNNKKLVGVVKEVSTYTYVEIPDVAEYMISKDLATTC